MARKRASLHTEDTPQQPATPNSPIQLAETKQMEIHHPNTEKKTFKQYLLEGFMIFVAVFMGFIAENIRENISNREHAKFSLWSVFSPHHTK